MPSNMYRAYPPCGKVLHGIELISYLSWLLVTYKKLPSMPGDLAEYSRPWRGAVQGVFHEQVERQGRAPMIGFRHVEETELHISSARPVRSRQEGLFWT